MQAAKLENFMKERKYDSLSDGLDALVAGINRVALQLPEGFKTKKYKLNFLYEAVVNYQWADFAVL